MRYAILLTLLPALLGAQEYEFVREWDSVQVEIDEYALPTPWTGGYVTTRPALCDLDGDDDKDCFIGHSAGTITYYENFGNANDFSFTLADTAWLDIDAGFYSSPTFLDFDQDGDFDLFVTGGNLSAGLFENIGDFTAPDYILIEDTLRQSTGAIIDAFHGCWADIDADGNFDYFAGDWDYGNISYYHNEGNGWNYSLQLITSNFTGIAVGGWPVPRFCDLDADGDLDLFIGNTYGQIWYFRNDGTPQEHNFNLISSFWQNIDVGDQAAPEFADMDADGDYDLWVGRDVYDLGSENTPGDVFYFENIGTSQIPLFQQIRSSNLTLDVGMSNRPLINDFDAGGNFDLIISNRDYLIYYQNSGTSSQPNYELVSEDYLTDILPHGFDLYDLDADGDQDLITANGALFSGEITFYQNIGPPQIPSYVYSFLLQTPYTLGQVTLADIDADGDGDMLVGTWGNGMVYYQNQGTPQNPNFVLQTENWQDIPSQRNCRLVDMDQDEDFDLLAGENTFGRVEFWKNEGTPQNAQMVLADSNFCDMEIYGPKPTAADLDNDGDMDLLVGSVDGGIYFFRNVTGETPAVPPPLPRTAPYRGPVLEVGPNPANPVTIFSFELRDASSVSLEVYDVSGRKVAELLSGR